jgi:hypothetical protein
MSFLASRRRFVQKRGRPATLRRQTAVKPAAYTDVALLVVSTHYSPEAIHEAVKQGDVKLATTNDEIAAAGWPGPPASTDLVILDGKTWSVEGVEQVFEAAVCIGFVLQVRGGQ